MLMCNNISQLLFLLVIKCGLGERAQETKIVGKIVRTCTEIEHSFIGFWRFYSSTSLQYTRSSWNPDLRDGDG